MKLQKWLWKKKAQFSAVAVIVKNRNSTISKYWLYIIGYRHISIQIIVIGKKKTNLSITRWNAACQSTVMGGVSDCVALAWFETGTHIRRLKKPLDGFFHHYRMVVLYMHCNTHFHTISFQKSMYNYMTPLNPDKKMC